MYNKNKLNISSKLTSYESPINIENEWDKLEQRMNKEKRRRIVPFWLLVFFAFSAGFSILYLTRKPLALTKENVAIASTNPKNDATNASINNVIGQAQQNSLVFQKDDYVVNAKSNINDTPQKQKSLNNKSLNKNIFAHNSSQYQYAKNGILPKNDLIQKIQTYENSEQRNTIKSNFHTQIQSIENSETNANSSTSQSAGDRIISINKIAEIVPSLFVTNYQTIEIPIPFINSVIVPIKKNDLWFDAGMTIGNPVVSYTNIASESIQLVNLKKKSELPLENIQWNLSIGKNIINDFYMKIGMQYIRTNDVLKASIIDTINSLLTNAVIGTYTNSEGLKQEIIGEQKKRTITEREISKYGSTKTLNAFFLAGKNFKLGKSQWSVEAGIGIPLWNGYTGPTLVNTNKLKNKTEVYTSDVNSSLLANLHYLYPIRNHTSIIGGYSFTKNKLSTNLGYSKITDVHSLSIGLRYFIH